MAIYRLYYYYYYYFVISDKCLYSGGVASVALEQITQCVLCFYLFSLSLKKSVVVFVELYAVAVSERAVTCQFITAFITYFVTWL